MCLKGLLARQAGPNELYNGLSLLKVRFKDNNRGYVLYKLRVARRNQYRSAC